MSSNFMMSRLPEIVKDAIQNRLWNDILPSSSFYLLAAPILLLLIGSLITMILGVFKTDPEKPCYPSWYVAVFICFASAALAITAKIETPVAFLGSGVLIDEISSVSFSVIAIGTLFTLMASSMTAIGKQLLRSELISLLLMSAAGLMIMCSAGEFLGFFIGLELTSISLYVLVGYQRKSFQGMEAAIKYFILGAAASAIILMGAALIYASIGSLRFSDFRNLNISIDHPFSLLGVLLLFSGLSFKLAIAPFHSWAPDVYQGANSHLTGFMASLVKFSIAIVFMRILSSSLGEGRHTSLIVMFWVLGAFSIVVGSLFGLVHNSLKRMLAYSSVANAGYFCLAFASLASNPTSLEAKQSLMSYAVIYAVLSMGAFTVIAWFEDHNREDLLKEELAGMGSKKPFAAFALTIFLFGFAGIPPVAGFFGKFFLILSAVNQGLIGLSIILVVFSCLSLYYYLSVMVEMWFKPSTRYSAQSNQDSETNSGMLILSLIAVIASLFIGIFGPRWAINLDYSQAVEKNTRIINTADTIEEQTQADASVIHFSR
ncbi:NADH-quinone oxidoreductase subunit N [Fluviispira sanaruensis]|uniref:NADH-quinone oxidoreductase subunit N n=1 Tax=Fluviispira sanaruensis TaxID=2493639 RepID=A0A4P2VZX2_FLUSA|nr:NADH-quinone oxidoreductase subunit N [Fluviispira sanaruensis]BBH54432.1 NADH-quinone oxidoreductase subunit N [Fluviispira sanaruensis]